MDKRSEKDLRLEMLAEKYEKLKKEFCDQKNMRYFDLLIDCGRVILPAHRFVLCSRSEILTQQLTPDVNELNWADYGEHIGIALLRWIYTNKVDVTLPKQLQSSSDQTETTTLFMACELLLSSLNEGTDEETIIKYQNIGKIAGADRLLAKCLELRPNSFFDSVVKSQQVKVNHQANTKLHRCGINVEVDTEIEQRINDLAEEVKRFEKILIGCRVFGTFSDFNVWHGWPAHEYFLSNRSPTIRDEILHAQNNSIYITTPSAAIVEARSVFLRWLYTDFLELESVGMASAILSMSSQYNLPTLLEQCDEASQKIVDISSCAHFHSIATRTGAIKTLKRCQELIKSYGKVLLSEGSLKMDVDFDNSSENSICEEETRELPLQVAAALLDLNDDCLFHVFHYLPLVDLGSIKDTCKRMSEVADQSFKLRKDKSITIQHDSMLADIWNLTHFGKLMNSLTVDSIYEEFASFSEICLIIAQYLNEQLKEFTFTTRLSEVPRESLPCFEKVLKNVETIKLYSYPNGEYINLLLGYCENLRDVDIRSYHLTAKPLLCSKNVNITCLTLNCLDVDQFLVEICEKLTHLECFEFSSKNISSNNISRLSKLDHLKRLRIGSFGNKIGNVLQKFAEKNHLEYLCLSNMIVGEALADSLGHFQNLKELVFKDVYKFEANGKNILSRTLANVEKLAFVGVGVGDKYQERHDVKLIQIVENLLNLKELSVNGKYYYDSFISRNNYLRLRKKRNLEIFLTDFVYKRTIERIADDLCKFVRLTPRPQDFFDKLPSPKVMK